MVHKIEIETRDGTLPKLTCFGLQGAVRGPPF